MERILQLFTELLIFDNPLEIDPKAVIIRASKGSRGIFPMLVSLSSDDVYCFTVRQV